MKSMTGYGRAKYLDENIDLEIEIRSVNSRFLDLRIKQPYHLSFMEVEISKQINKMIVRGKVDVNINLNLLKAPDMEFNEDMAKAYWELYKKAKEIVKTDAHLPFAKLLSEKDVMRIGKTEINEENMSRIIISTLDEAITTHQKMALTEGDSMKKYCLNSLSTMSSALNKIEAEFPKYKKDIYSKLKDNIEELLGTFIKEEDHKKLLLETAIYVEKADITEEIVRLNNHIDKFSALLEEKTELGKKLNFILQEMHREINTIGSKFNSTKVFDDIILIKEEIEKCREIIQNVR
ncbi:MAG: YicC family protein [Candidatus Cloacimonetes bacterium]|nr:YicC family protein [Candidatus Cloacimonadota bacterium]